MPRSKTRRVYPDVQKEKAVSAIMAGRLTIQEWSKKHKVADTIVRRWCQDKRYGGTAGFTNRKAGASNGEVLPTRERTTREYPKRAKRPLPVIFACAHCGGLIDMSDRA